MSRLSPREVRQLAKDPYLVSRGARLKPRSEHFQHYALNDPRTSQAVLWQLKSGLRAKIRAGDHSAVRVGSGAVPSWSLQEQEVGGPGHTQNARYALDAGVLFREHSEASQHPTSP